MVEVKVSSGRLKVEVLGWSKLWALKSRLEFPLGSVKAARINDLTNVPPSPIRWPGTGVPGFIKAGTFYSGFRKGKTFWDVRRRRENVLVIELAGADYEALVVEIADAAAAKKMIDQALVPFASR